MLDDKTTIMLKQEMLLQITNNLYQKNIISKDVYQKAQSMIVLFA